MCAHKCRCAPITAVVGQHLFVFGGCDLTTRAYLDDAWLYDFSTHTWRRCAAEGAELAEPRSHGVAVAVPSKRAVLVFGGAQYFNGVYFRDVLVLKQLRALVEAPTHATEALIGAKGHVKGRQGTCVFFALAALAAFAAVS